MRVMVGLLVALAVLATLQYRWISQVSQAELERSQARLRDDTAKFAYDFNDEIQRVFVALHDKPAALAARDRLITNLYRFERGRLLMFNRSSGAFEPADWPPALAGVRERIPRAPEHPGPPPRGGGPAMDEGTPLLLVPPHPPHPEEPPGPLTIVELNAAYLEKELLPRLQQKYFSGEDGYAVRIVNRARSARLVYESDPGLAASFFAVPDSRTTIFD